MSSVTSSSRLLTPVGLALAFTLVPASYAAPITWADSAGNTTWTTNSAGGGTAASASWVGGNAPVNSVTTDNAIFTSVSNAQPNLTVQTRITGVDFQMAAGGLAMTGNNNLFQVGAGGIDSSLQTSGTNTITNTRILVNDSASIWNLFSTANTASPSTFTFNSTVSLNANTLIIVGQRNSAAGNVGNINFTGAITGNATGVGSLTINSTSTNNNVTFSGNNTYTGLTIVSAGNVTLQNDQSAASGGWSIVSLSGSGATQAATVNLSAGSTLAVASANKIQVGTTANSGAFAASTLNVAGTVTNNGTLQLERASTVNLNNGAAWTQNGNLTISGRGGSSTSAALNVNSGANMTYSRPNTVKLNVAPGGAGNGNLTIDGTGRFTTGAGFENTTTTATGGNGRVTLTNGGTLRLSADVANLTNQVTFNLGTGGGVIDNNGFTTTLSGAVTGSGNSTGTPQTGITGTGGLTSTGTGTLTLTGNNTYGGGTIVSAGTLLVNNTTGSGTGSGPVTVSSGATLGGTGAISGATTVNGGTINGTLSLTTLVATGNSTIASSVSASGGTTISSGNLTVSGILGGGAVTIQSGATLKGAGTVNGATTVQSGGFLSPGNSPDLLTFGNTLVMAGTTTMEISGAGTVRGVNTANGYDAINVTNNLTWGGTLDIVAIGGFNFNQAGSYNLFDFGTQSGSFASGAISVGGTALTAFDIPTQVWSANNGSNTFAYSFDLDDGVLAVTAIPEPSTYAAVAGLGMIGFALYRRRRQQKSAAAV